MYGSATRILLPRINGSGKACGAPSRARAPILAPSRPLTAGSRAGATATASREAAGVSATSESRAPSLVVGTPLTDCSKCGEVNPLPLHTEHTPRNPHGLHGQHGTHSARSARAACVSGLSWFVFCFYINCFETGLEGYKCWYGAKGTVLCTTMIGGKPEV